MNAPDIVTDEGDAVDVHELLLVYASVKELLQSRYELR